MKHYSYDKTTYEYKGSTEARENPKEKDEYLLPAFATFIEPPEAGDNEVAVFDVDEQSWSIQADYRGQTYYSVDTGVAVTFTNIGDEPDDTMTSLVPPSSDHEWGDESWVLSLETAISLKLDELARQRYDVETGGIDVDGMVIATDDRTKTLVNGAKSLADVGDPTGTMDFKVNSTTWTTITYEQVIAIATALGVFVQECFTAEKIHSEAIQALTTVDEVEAYDITTDWPDNA